LIFLRRHLYEPLIELLELVGRIEILGYFGEKLDSPFGYLDKLREESAFQGVKEHLPRLCIGFSVEVAL